MHGFGLDPCHSSASCFTRGNEMELHPYDVDARMIFPLIFVRLDEILASKYLEWVLFGSGFYLGLFEGKICYF